MSKSLGSDLHSGDNLDFPDFQEDRSRDSDGDLLVEAEEDAWTAEPSTAVAAMVDPTRSDYPSFEKLYGESLAVLGASASTVSGFQGLFLFWVHFCEEKANRIAYIDPDTTTGVENLFGLNLYYEDAFTGEEIFTDRYDENLIIDFFKWLEVESGSTNHFTKAKGFFNAHLRAEHYKRMAAAGHLNPRVGVAKVGNNPVIKTMCTLVMKRTGTNAMDNFVDLYTKADDCWTPQQIRGNVSGYCLHGRIVNLPQIFIFIFFRHASLRLSIQPRWPYVET